MPDVPLPPPGDDPASHTARMSNVPLPPEELFETRPAPYEPVGPPDPSELAPPRYRVIRPHAKGGIGEIFLAEDREVHRQVALKEIQPRFAGHHASRRRFLREAEITGNLEHPGIVPVYGLGAYPDGRPFYAMRFIEGQTLQQAIEHFHDAATGTGTEKRLAFRELLGRFIAVCNAIAFAHSRGVIHRDLKPSNVMLGRFGETLVVDWGLAAEVLPPDDTVPSPGDRPAPAGGEALIATRAERAAGTPTYMSPEQADGRLGEVGPTSDVYSLGATLYCLLTGRPPVGGSTVDEVLDKVIAGDVQPARLVRPGCPPALDAVCRKAMAPHAADRYRSVLALAADVGRWLADEPVSCYRDPPAVRLSRWGRRHRSFVAASAALFVTASAALAVGLVAVTAEQRRTAEQKRVAEANERSAASYAREAKEQAGWAERGWQAEAQRRRQARAALDAMTSEMVERLLARQKELLPEHKEFLRQALKLYEEFAADAPPDGPGRLGVAQAHFRAGMIREQLGEHAEAEAAYGRALELYAALSAAAPGDAEPRAGLAKTHNNLANVLSGIGRAADAEPAYHNALALYRRLVADVPGEPKYRVNLAKTYNNLGVLFLETDRLSDAITAFRDALAVYEKLAADYPGEADHRANQAKIRGNLAVMLLQAKEPREADREARAALALCRRLVAEHPTEAAYRDILAAALNNLANLIQGSAAAEAEQFYREALTLRKRLAADYPAVPEYRSDLAASFSNLGELLAEANRPADAEAAHRDALALRRQLAADFPQVPQHQADLGSTFNSLGLLALARSDWTAARELLAEGVAHQREAVGAAPRHPAFLQSLCNLYGNLARACRGGGDHVAAARAAESLAGVRPGDGGDAYAAACHLALCVPLAGNDGSLAEEHRERLARDYGDRAVAQLRKSAEKGYATAERLRDGCFDSLRRRADFRKLAGSVEVRDS